MKKLRIGIAGLGRLGKSHARNLAFKVTNAELVAACSIAEDELAWARSELGIEACYTDYSQMLREAALDAVFIVTSTTMHADQIVEALEAGLHVFSEKPLALNMADCERVVAVADRHPEQVSVIGFVRRYDPAYAYAKRKIEEGAIGTPVLFRGNSADLSETAPFQVDFCRTSGGMFLDFTIHDIDLARWLLGSEVADVYCAGGCYVHKGFEQHQDADNATGLYRFKSGALATLTTSRTAVNGHDTHAEVVGTEGSLIIGRTPRLVNVEIADRHGVRSECVQTFFDRFAEAFLLEVQDFVDCVLNGRIPRGASLRDACENTRTAIAVTKSYRSGELVKL